MIVTKTPLRLSFFGGGSDIPAFFEKSPGLVVSTSINKHIQIAINKCEPRHIKVIYSEFEQVNDVENVKHTRAKEILKHFNVKSNIEIVSFSDITTNGSGLGSSSSYTVGLINGIYNHLKYDYNKKDLAEMACDIEIEKCREPIGKQDQYAAAYGGFNAMHFYNDGVEVIPLGMKTSNIKTLNENLLCYNTGITRKTSDILSNQVNMISTNSKTFENTKIMVELAKQSIDYLKHNKIDDFGSLLHEGWILKRELAPNITNEHIDDMYETAMSAGALGGKLLGAGGGGYMLFYVPQKYQDSVKSKMKEYRRFHFNFTDMGSSAITI
jgi:D-glycero-alpha-D-manno-heptose-7-phosphate kinase